MPFFQSYPAAYKTLYRGRPITCATTGEVFDALPPPVAVILDVRISYFLIGVYIPKRTADLFIPSPTSNTSAKRQLCSHRSVYTGTFIIFYPRFQTGVSWQNGRF